MREAFRIACLIAIVLTCGELGARYYLSGSFDCLRPSSDPELVYELRPGTYASDGWFLRMPTVSIRIGDDGCRAVPVEGSTMSDLPVDILFLGDSMTFGLGVEDAESLPSVVAGNLSRSTQRAAVVRNCGVPGYNLSQAVRALEVRIAERPPRLVAWMVHPADLEPPVDFSSLSPKSSVLRTLIESSRLARLVYLLTRILRIQSERSDAQGAYSAAQVEQLIDRMAAAVRTTASQLVVIEIASQYGGVDLEALLRARQIPYMRLTEQPHTSENFLADGEHWTPSATARLAQEAAPFVERHLPRL